VWTHRRATSLRIPSCKGEEAFTLVCA
jgi:hypothetical protein